MIGCLKIRGRTITFPILLSVALLPIVIIVLTGCAGGAYEPYYDEPIDIDTILNSQIAYSGSDFEILWDKDSVDNSNIDIILYRGKAFVDFIDSRVSNNGSYWWTVPESLSPGGNYRIYIRDNTEYLYALNITIRPYSPIDGYEPDNTQNEATAISLFDKAQTHALDTGDVDWFYFAAAADSCYAIETYENTCTYARLVLLVSPDSSINYYYNDQQHSQNAKVLWQCKASGKYFFNVSSSSTSGGRYHISLQPYRPINDLVILRPDTGAFLTPGSTDTIAWLSSFSTNVSIALFNKDSLIYLIDSSAYNAAWYNGRKQAWIVPSGLDSSPNYHIRISDEAIASAAFYSGYFTIALRPDNAEPDNSPAQAFATRPDTSLINRTITADDGDWFRFDATMGQTYEIATTGFTDMRLFLYDRDGITVIGSNDDDYASQKNALIVWICTASGLYYIKAHGFTSTTTGLYDLLLKTGKTPSLSVKSPATPCTTGSTLYINWSTSGSVGELIRIELVNDSNVMILGATAVHPNAFYWSVSQDIPSGSNYRIKITSLSNSLITALSPPFSIISKDEEPDTLKVKADTLRLFGELHQRTLPQNDSDWIVFHAIAGHIYSIGIDEISVVYLSLYTSNDSLITTKAKTTISDANAKIRWICRKDGAYYVLIRSGVNFKSPRYSIVIFEE